MSRTRWIVLIAVVAAVAAFFALDLGQYFSLDYFKSQQAAIDAYYRAHPLQTVARRSSRSTSRSPPCRCPARPS